MPRWMLCFLCAWTGHTWAAFEHHLVRAHWLPRPPMPTRVR
jgi:hypothetical protein